MNKYSAFNGLNTAEKAELIEQINAKEKLYEKGRRIFTLTSESDETGILIQGLAYLVSINNYGEENILEYYSPGNIFGSYFSPDTNVNLYAITAKKDCNILVFKNTNIVSNVNSVNKYHIKFINNVITSASRKSQIHIDILSQRTIRKKLLTYLSYLSENEGTRTLTLPIPLSDLADYICVDRSAMMREIRKMNNESIITSKGKVISIL